ncbi:hypothetical protein [Curvivirga sp.]|uniref:hypothetical protein n=1 Tax=Curvivirga sp. TaxID=2856848 RepID=UPI003B5C6160
MIERPSGVGPHETRELELMLKGSKPLSMFYDVIPASIKLPEDDFEPYVQTGQFVKQEFQIVLAKGGYKMRYLYYALPTEAWRIEALHTITKETMEGIRPSTDDDEREIGSLLGYKKDDVEIYIDWINESKKASERS